MAEPDTGVHHVLYLVICAAPPASQVHELIALAQWAAWEVCVIATPQATKFLDSSQLTALTGHPVRVEYKLPGQDDPLPQPDAIAVVPATFNTINKWALGIADTLAVSVLCEHLGRGIPLVAVPCLKADLAQHPAFRKSISILKRYGVRLLYEPKKYRAPEIVPWTTIVAELAKSNTRLQT